MASSETQSLETLKDWCNSMKLEFINTDSYNDSYDKYRDIPLQDLSLQAGECKFCADAADMTEYRLRHVSTWIEKYGVYNNGDPVRPTKDEIMAVKVRMSIYNWRETRSWSFSFEGVSYRTLLTIYAICGQQRIEIVLRRFNTGGHVSITIKSDRGDGDYTVTYISPLSCRECKPDDISPHGGFWKDHAKQTIASLELTFGRLWPLIITFDTIKAWM
ncbi:hypothetical protein FP744_10007110 [Trichoderma asperellum]|nr:hypothetical protein LI328DRAFT_148346 [Trichoderma asperelloides]